MRETRWKGNLVSLGSVLPLLPRGLFNNPFPRDVINENSSDSAAIVFSTRFAHSRSWSTMVISLKIGNGHGSMWNCASWLLLWFRDSPTGSPHWWPGTPGILKMIYISRNLMPVGCFTGPTTLDFMKFNISRPRNYGLMDFTTESTESWMCSNGIYIYFEIYFSNLAVLSLNSFFYLSSFSSNRSKKLVRLVHRLIWSSLAHTEIREKKISQERCFSQNLPPRSSRELHPSG